MDTVESDQYQKQSLSRIPAAGKEQLRVDLMAIQSAQCVRIVKRLQDTLMNTIYRLYVDPLLQEFIVPKNINNLQQKISVTSKLSSTTQGLSSQSANSLVYQTLRDRFGEVEKGQLCSLMIKEYNSEMIKHGLMAKYIAALYEIVLEPRLECPPQLKAKTRKKGRVQAQWEAQTWKKIISLLMLVNYENPQLVTFREMWSAVFPKHPLPHNKPGRKPQGQKDKKICNEEKEEEEEAEDDDEEREEQQKQQKQDKSDYQEDQEKIFESDSYQESIDKVQQRNEEVDSYLNGQNIQLKQPQVGLEQQNQCQSLVQGICNECTDICVECLQTDVQMLKTEFTSLLNGVEHLQADVYQSLHGNNNQQKNNTQSSINNSIDGCGLCDSVGKFNQSCNEREINSGIEIQGLQQRDQSNKYHGQTQQLEGKEIKVKKQRYQQDGNEKEKDRLALKRLVAGYEEKAGEQEICEDPTKKRKQQLQIPSCLDELDQNASHLRNNNENACNSPLCSVFRLFSNRQQQFSEKMNNSNDQQQQQLLQQQQQQQQQQQLVLLPFKDNSTQGCSCCENNNPSSLSHIVCPPTPSHSHLNIPQKQPQQKAIINQESLHLESHYSPVLNLQINQKPNNYHNNHIHQHNAVNQQCIHTSSELCVHGSNKTQGFQLAKSQQLIHQQLALKVSQLEEIILLKNQESRRTFDAQERLLQENALLRSLLKQQQQLIGLDASSNSIQPSQSGNQSICNSVSQKSSQRLHLDQINRSQLQYLELQQLARNTLFNNTQVNDNKVTFYNDAHNHHHNHNYQNYNNENNNPSHQKNNLREFQFPDSKQLVQPLTFNNYIKNTLEYPQKSSDLNNLHGLFHLLHSKQHYQEQSSQGNQNLNQLTQLEQAQRSQSFNNSLSALTSEDYARLYLTGQLTKPNVMGS